jgi:hypothetical protein
MNIGSLNTITKTSNAKKNVKRKRSLSPSISSHSALPLPPLLEIVTATTGKNSKIIASTINDKTFASTTTKDQISFVPNKKSNETQTNSSVVISNVATNIGLDNDQSKKKRRELRHSELFGPSD